MKKFNYIIFIILAFFILIVITGENIFKISIGSSEYGSYVGVFLYIFLILFSLLILNFLTNYKIVERRLIIINRFYHKIVYIFFLFIVYQILQFVILSNKRALLFIPKYIFFILIILLGSAWGLKFVRRNLDTLIKFGLISCITFILLYSIHFFLLPFSTGFRINRLSILLGNAVEDGGVFSVFFPFLLFYQHKNNFLKITLLTLFIYYMIYYNGTRSSLFAIITSIFIYLLFKKISRRKIILFFLIFIVSLLILIPSRKSFVKYDSAFSLHGITAAWNGSYHGNLAIRIGNIWAPMIKHTINNSPILGFGNGSWATQSRMIGFRSSNSQTYIYNRSPHNAFLVYYVDWGIFGFLLMIYFFYWGIRTNYRIIGANKYTNLRKYGNIGLCAWINFLLWCLTGNAHNWAGWLIFAFLNIYTILLKKEYENTVAVPISD